MRRVLGPSILLVFILAATMWAQQSSEQAGPVAPQPQTQQGQPAQPPSQAEQEQPTTPAPAVADPNLVPGHPLDPHDVDVLTGKLDRPSTPPATVYVDPYGQGGYGYAYRRNRFFGPRLFDERFTGRRFGGRGGRGFLPPRFFFHF